MRSILTASILFLLLCGTAGAQVCLYPTEGLDLVCARLAKQDASCERQNPGTVAFDEKSCLLADGNKIIQEVVDLPLTEIPPEIYTKYSTKAIAESLVYRFFKRNESERIKRTDVKNPYVDLYHDTSLLMAIKIGNFESILNKGFLNQFQVGRSAGKYEPISRTTTESILMKILFDPSPKATDIMNFVRPKYAYLTFDVDKSEIGRAWASDQYGNIFIRFKDEVKKRSTFSNGDSLDFITRPRGYNFEYGDFESHSFFYNQENFKIHMLDSYYEAQIWGPLDSKDIDYILVGCFEGVPSNQEQVIAILKAKKLKTPVFTCQSVGASKWLTFKPKDKLYPL